MRPILLYIFLITGSVAVAQSSTEGNTGIQKTIDDFFLAFHQQDTTFIRIPYPEFCKLAECRGWK